MAFALQKNPIVENSIANISRKNSAAEILEYDGS